MQDLQEFIDQFTQPERPERDGGGRPLLIPRGGGDRKAYTRASGLADHLEEFSFLWKWKMRGLARGLSERMDLIRLIAAENYTCGFAESEKGNRAAGRNIDGYIERALEQAGVSQKADYGTAIHLRTEPGNEGTDPDDKQISDVDSCWELWVELGVAHLGTEIFTANDELMSAGTFDHLMWVPGYGIVITDKKTSREVKGSGFRIQLSGYSRSDIYNWETDERQTLEEYVESLGWDPALINRQVGLIHWIKEGKTTSWRLDLEAGYEWARIAARVRDEHRKGKHEWPADKAIASARDRYRAEVIEMIAEARTVADLEALWKNPQVQASWTDAATEAAKARRKELES